jgi:hypothetical protein
VGEGALPAAGRLFDAAAHPLDISLHIVRRDAKKAHAVFGDEFFAYAIPFCVFSDVVDWAIDLDREAMLLTVEVQHEDAYRMLPPELQPRQLPITQPHPKRVLRRRRFPPPRRRHVSTQRSHGAQCSAAGAALTPLPPNALVFNERYGGLSR